MICDGTSVRLHRVAWKDAKPTSLEGTNVILTNDHGSAIAPFEYEHIQSIRHTYIYGLTSTFLLYSGKNE